MFHYLPDDDGCIWSQVLGMHLMSDGGRASSPRAFVKWIGVVNDPELDHILQSTRLGCLFFVAPDIRPFKAPQRNGTQLTVDYLCLLIDNNKARFSR